MRDAGDLYGLRNNFQRVFVTLLDGLWHGAAELQNVGGQNFAARARELREDRCGNLVVRCRKNPHGPGSQYKLDLSTVTDEIQERILSGKLPPRRRKKKTCPACKGKGTVPSDFTMPAPPVKMVEPTRWNDVFDLLAG